MWSFNSPFLGRQPKRCCLKNKERWTSLRLMTTPLKTSKWRLSVGTPANATACIWDGAALKASWLFLFCCDQCSLNIQRHMGPVPPVWTSWFSTQFCFFLFNKADGRQEIDRAERVIWIYWRNTKNGQLLLSRLSRCTSKGFSGKLQLLRCIFGRQIVYHSAARI